jgi:crotonobetainyl-CoA:carnitine CoA-transferase CaiB-like acyl-CoA transferase
LQTRAVRDGDDFVINGQKIWTSGAHTADAIFMLVRTDPLAPKHRGISFLLVDDIHTPGLSVRPLVDMGDRHYFNETFFEDVRVPADHLVGEENRGWYVGMTLLDFERSNIGGAVGSRRMIARMIDDLADLAGVDGGEERVSAPARAEIADRYIETEVMFQFSFRIISMQHRGIVPNYEASMSKLFNSELAQRLSQTATRAFGLRALRWGDGSVGARYGEMYIRMVPATIRGGPSEVQRNVIDPRSGTATRMSSGATGPLRGIRILEFTQIIAGPVAGIHLSDLGAEVVKVEPPRGEDRRNTAAVVLNEGKYFQSLNRGKRSLTIDLRADGARDLVQRIVPHFDVVLSNYRFGVAERLGVDYASLRDARPDLIYASITGFGEGGPHATRAGSDIVAQAYTGLMAAEGKTDEHGSPLPQQAAPVIDRASGIAAAMAVCAALFERERTGRGQELQLSLLQTGLELLSNRVMIEPVHDATSRDPHVEDLRRRREQGASYRELLDLRQGAVRRFASHRLYYGGYDTKAGAIVLGAVTQQNREAIRSILGMDDDTDDADFDAAAPDVDERIEAYRAAFLEAGVPATLVNFPEEMADDPQVEAMGLMSALVHPLTGPQRVVGPIVRMSVTPTAASGPAPPLAAHTRAILEECGLSDEEIDTLVETGVVTEPS